MSRAVRIFESRRRARFVPGFVRFTVFNTFVASSRNCSDVRPPAGCRGTRRGRRYEAGAVDDAARRAAVGADRRQRERRGVEPQLDQLLARAAAVELGSPMRSARSLVLPSKLRS